MVYLKLEAISPGSIGIIERIHFFDSEGNRVYITKNDITDNMNTRITQASYNSLLDLPSGEKQYEPYLEHKTLKGFYIFKLPYNVERFDVYGWTNTTYGRPYSISVSLNNIDYVTIVENAPNGAFNKVSKDISQYQASFYYLIQDSLGVHSIKNNMIEQIASEPTKATFLEKGVKKIKGVDWSKFKDPIKILQFSDVDIETQAVITKKISMYNATLKQYDGPGKVIIEMNEVPVTAKKIKIDLLCEGNITFKCALKNSITTTTPLSAVKENTKTQLIIDLTKDPFTQMIKQSKENPLSLIAECTEGSYITAAAYSWT